MLFTWNYILSPNGESVIELEHIFYSLKFNVLDNLYHCFNSDYYFINCETFSLYVDLLKYIGTFEY